MPSHIELCDELLKRLKSKERFTSMGEEPIYYIVFSPREMLEMKRGLRVLLSRLELDGWKPRVLSLASVVNDILRNDGNRAVLLDAEKSALAEGDVAAVTESLRSILVATGHDGVTAKIIEAIESLASQEGALLLITDVEALHPYLRIGAVEQRLQGRCRIPVIILYPGERTGNSSLKFLGIWPDDGNYRSTHIG